MTPRAMLPTDVKSYEGVKATPLYLAGILSFFGAAMIGHALVTSVRRRRRERALLKTLGLSTGRWPHLSPGRLRRSPPSASWLGCPPGYSSGDGYGRFLRRRLGCPARPSSLLQGTLGGARCAYPGEPDRGRTRPVGHAHSGSTRPGAK